MARNVRQPHNGVDMGWHSYLLLLRTANVPTYHPCKGWQSAAEAPSRQQALPERRFSARPKATRPALDARRHHKRAI